jgi:hypothetical protein
VEYREMSPDIGDFDVAGYRAGVSERWVQILRVIALVEMQKLHTSDSDHRTPTSSLSQGIYHSKTKSVHDQSP